MRVVIVGGVAGGATAAARLRRRGEATEIVVLERGEHVSFANCGLPYHLGGAIPERERLFLMDPQRFKASLNVDVRVRSEVVAIDTVARTVLVRDLALQSEYTLSYDHLLLSPGATPARPPLPGVEHPRVLTVRNVPDIDAVKALVDQGKVRSAVVAGAGFIGLEMAENLRERGVEVHLVEALDQVMAPLDYEMAALVAGELADRGVHLHLSESIQSFGPSGDGVAVALASGRNLSADLVVLSVGVRPDTSLAARAGLALDERGHILVDSRLRTSAEGVWAVGDATSSRSPLLHRPAPVPLAGPANKQARLAADNISGDDKEWKGALGTAIAKVFGLAAGATGLSEKVCRREGIPHRSVVVHPQSHASYYPGARPYSLKLVWNPNDGKILGAQAVGADGIDKRLDVISAFLGMGATIGDLERFEQAYAPPFSGAKDGVNFAGFAAANIQDGLSTSIGWEEFETRRARGSLVLDVRTPHEHSLGSVDGAMNIPHTQLRERLSELPRDREILIHCAVGIRGYLAERILREAGFGAVSNLSGGYRSWQAVRSARRPTPGAAPGPTSPAAMAAISPPEKPAVEVDACGLQCPGPILRLKEAADALADGETMVVKATDPGFARDAEAWCHMTGNVLLGMESAAGVWTARLRKGAAPAAGGNGSSPRDFTSVVFSNDLDRALASFVIANGAAASGKQATLFFTFWGLSVIRRKPEISPRKDLVAKGFDLMMPRGARKLALSRMNFGGLGSALMRWRMARKEVDHLEEMIASAQRSGVRLVACQMSMDLMGIHRDELLEGVEIGGVAAYLDAASQAGINLFI